MRTAEALLPQTSGPLIGRGRELDEIRQRLIDDQTRLLTLTGTRVPPSTSAVLSMHAPQ